MRLQRVQIPNFRVLKDIDIIFEQYHIPQTFLLASQNGGGKSTFIQLIFVLLKGCSREESEESIRNLLKNSNLDSSLANSSISTITLIENDKSIKLEIDLKTYDSLLNIYLGELNSNDHESNFNRLKQDGIHEFNIYIKQLETEVFALKERHQLECETRTGFLSLMRDKDRNPLLTEIIANAMIESGSNEKPREASPMIVLAQANHSIKKIEKEIVDIEEKIQSFNLFLSEVNTILSNERNRVIHVSQNTCLTYKFSGNEDDFDLVDLSKRISACIAMASPSSQVFLFLSPDELNSLFDDSSEYYSILKHKQEDIKNLFLFELSLVKVLADVFRVAFENDRAQALKSGGKYGNEFELLLNDLKDFLQGKTIQPSEDMSRIVIKMRDVNNLEIELSPADLSHGELRQLALYA